MHTTHGTEIKDIEIKTPYYERVIHKKITTPWLGEYAERFYMNQLKELEFGSTQSYKDLKLGVEHFSEKDLFWPILLLIVLIVIWIKLM